MQIFISHSSLDKPTARRIKEHLETKGLDVWLDEAEIRVGDSIPEKVSNGLKESEVVCILLSKNSSASFWVKRELNAFLPECINSKKVLLPCKLEDAEIPYLISDIKYADFTKSFDEGISEVLLAFRLNEEVVFIEEAQRLKSKMINDLSHSELAYTMFRIYEKSKAGYFIGDRRSQTHPYELLGKLESIGFFEVTVDKYEKDYSYSDKALKALEMLYQEERELLEMLRRNYEGEANKANSTERKKTRG